MAVSFTCCFDFKLDNFADTLIKSVVGLANLHNWVVKSFDSCRSCGWPVHVAMPMVISTLLNFEVFQVAFDIATSYCSFVAGESTNIAFDYIMVIVVETNPARSFTSPIKKQLKAFNHNFTSPFGFERLVIGIPLKFLFEIN